LTTCPTETAGHTIEHFRVRLGPLFVEATWPQNTPTAKPTIVKEKIYLEGVFVLSAVATAKAA